MDLEQIAIEGFLALTCLLGPSDDHIKSHQLLDTGKVVNLHKFKMAAVQSLNLQCAMTQSVPFALNVSHNKSMTFCLLPKFDKKFSFFDRRGMVGVNITF